MITKKRVLNAFRIFPDEFTLEEAIDALILLEKIERGDRQSKEGIVITTEELERENERWVSEDQTDLLHNDSMRLSKQKK